jgi:hypothetical protein
MAEDTITHYISPLSALIAIKEMTTIALRAHDNNPSPVDIKLALAALDHDQLLQIHIDLTRIIKANS